jgi:hypothetical protein
LTAYFLVLDYILLVSFGRAVPFLRLILPISILGVGDPRSYDVNMVNLASVSEDPKPNPARQSTVPGLEHITLEAPGEDEFSTSVYGSRFAAEDLPSKEMPEKEMPKEIAYRMIKDELSLDGNPMLK